MAEQDFYQLLGVHPAASKEELKEAFRRLAQKYHPDRGSINPEDVELFKRITEAYRTLSNMDTRNLYNKENGYQFHEELSVSGMDAPSKPEEAGGKRASVDIAGGIQDMSQLHRMTTAETDLNEQHRVNSLSEEERMESGDSDEAEMAAWGDLESTPVGGGIFSNLLGGRKKNKVSYRRSDLKKNLKKTFQSESIPKRPSSSINVEPTKRPEVSREEEQPQINDPLRQERTFKFQISALEAALGTTREAVLSAGQDRISKLDVEIPPGTEDGAEIEFSRGWDRATAKISVVQDPLIQVRGLDIHSRIPITLKEALDGAKITIPGVDGVLQVNLKSGKSSLEPHTIEGAGIPGKAEKGNHIVHAYIVAPNQQSATLDAAVQAVDKNADGDSIRREFLSNPLDERFSLEDGNRIALFVPITFSEALSGVKISTRIRSVDVSLAIPKQWNHHKELLNTDYMSELQRMIYIYPQIAFPENVDATVQAAALAIEQHFLSGPRANLQRSLITK